MSFQSSLFILFLCIPIHTYAARLLVLDRTSKIDMMKVSGKVEENIEKGRRSTEVTKEKDNCHSATTQKPKSTKGSFDLKKLKNTKEEVSGMGQEGGEVLNCGHVGLLKATSTKGPRRRSLWIKASGSNVKQNVDSGENNNVEEEDADQVKDYAPPHQTPPIHNRET
ncbi:hypothetical protein O6P43_029830 [Quillaja saponaria]|uniref:Uncharacterized protein n=1 Tax=Quillaja saponaria TaxID=32244 RepID=A0AAD7L154_QUISA|nr:hypothetical protein O6P43_029830 [Quillaja saponaria]